MARMRHVGFGAALVALLVIALGTPAGVRAAGPSDMGATNSAAACPTYGSHLLAPVRQGTTDTGIPASVAAASTTLCVAAIAVVNGPADASSGSAPDPGVRVVSQAALALRVVSGFGHTPTVRTLLGSGPVDPSAWYVIVTDL